MGPLLADACGLSPRWESEDVPVLNWRGALSGSELGGLKAMQSRALRLSHTLRLFWRFHRCLYAATKGRVGSSLLGRRVILLRTKGRRSGASREVALFAFDDRGRDVIVASYVGEPNHPAWYLNLKADPSVLILEKGRWARVRARVRRGDERARLWAEISGRDPNVQEYQDRTSRQIPVVILDPAEER